MKIGVLLAGCGVYDGSEIHEAVFTLLAIDELGAEAVCMAPDTDQHHVVNHLNGDEMNEKRNVLIESARIARGAVQSLSDIDISQLDGLVIPGGFGAAKNLNQWALSGPDGDINPEVRKIIRAFRDASKPIAGLCMGPTVIAKAFEGSDVHATLTVGSTAEASPYDIEGISKGMESIGAKSSMRTLREVEIDNHNLIVTAPCYMMEGSIKEIRANIKKAIEELVELIQKAN